MINTGKAIGKPLSGLEQQIMEAVWARGHSSAEQIREDLALKHPMKDSTVRTLLRRLVEKGYASYTVDGRTYIYQGAEKPRNVAVHAVRQILDRFCGGSLEQLLTGLVENEVVSQAELQQLAQKIARRKALKGDEK